MVCKHEELTSLLLQQAFLKQAQLCEHATCYQLVKVEYIDEAYDLAFFSFDLSNKLEVSWLLMNDPHKLFSTIKNT